MRTLLKDNINTQRPWKTGSVEVYMDPGNGVILSQRRWLGFGSNKFGYTYIKPQKGHTHTHTHTLTHTHTHSHTHSLTHSHAHPHPHP